MLYCAGSGDFIPLHWFQSVPQAQAIGDQHRARSDEVVVARTVVSDWVGSDGWVRSVSGQDRGMDPQGTEWTVNGVWSRSVRATGRNEIEVEVWTENADQQRTTPGRAVVVVDA